ncbi:MAG: malto-oligosyltrehalose trehalohydrolase [Desulfotomaculaceae bacterium]|nr:malto-oligosyltrehalose trehalohydrolase [Desulfotomaculaceae bacterium]
MTGKVSLGAIYMGDGRCRFTVWAPLADQVAVHIVSPRERLAPLARGERGYYQGEVTDIEPGNLYYYLLDGKKERPDPASRRQPQGVHGPSQVVDPQAFIWTDQSWFGPARQDLVFYELHVGTFTPEGAFEAVIPHLEGLKELGVTAVEIMPVAQFPGSRNWGYDGVNPFAAQNSYGGPEGLKSLVDSCHQHGLAVFLDVVYNHLGPEGNYLRDFGPYFTDRYLTPWGQALNFDGPGSDEVRRFFIENALYWLTECHIDGLRLDAVHAINDMSALHFLEELAATVRHAGDKLARRVYVVAESDLNDPRLIRPRAVGGYGLDCQWSDDFHHALHALLAGEQGGYYRDFGQLQHLVRALRLGYVFTGQYSTYRQRRHGRKTHLCETSQFVVFTQNHDQVGNRAWGERLSQLVSFDRLKLAAAMLLLSPFIPLIFMGEEYGETAPFFYFTSHSDPDLVEAVRQGRREEFVSFGWAGDVPDPQDEATFLRSRLEHSLCRQDRHATLYRLYRELLLLRRELPELSGINNNMEVAPIGREPVLLWRRWDDNEEFCAVFSFNIEESNISLPLSAGFWHKLLDSAEEQWLGDGSKVAAAYESPGEVRLILSPLACLLFKRIKEA